MLRVQVPNCVEVGFSNCHRPLTGGDMLIISVYALST